MNGVDKLVKTILDAIKQEKKTKSYYCQAGVMKIEGNTVWVHIPNGVNMTPVQKTIDCKVGDTVQVRVGDGTATITGNNTAPPTDDTKAIKADANAKTANTKAIKAQETADNANKQVKRLNQYFWTKDGNGSEAGAHITEIPQSEFEANPAGGNLLLRSAGIYLRDGLTKLVQILATGITIGQTSKCHIIIEAAKMRFYDGVNAFLTLARDNDEGYSTVSHGASYKTGGAVLLSDVLAKLRDRTTNGNYESIGQLYIENTDLAEEVRTNMSAGINNNGTGVAAASVSTSADIYGNSNADISAKEITFNSYSPFTTETTQSTSVSVNAGATADVSLPFTTPTGYAPIAVSRIKTGGAAICDFQITSGNVKMKIRNATSTAATYDVYAVVLFTAIQ